MTAPTEFKRTVELLSGGTCRAGCAARKLPAPPGIPMGGHSWGGSVGLSADEDLWARALYLCDASNPTEEVVLCFLDLLSGSRKLLRYVAQELEDVIHCRRIVLAGTHTHTAPGMYFGNSFYDLMAQNTPALPICEWKFNKPLAKGFAHAIAEAVKAAKASVADAKLAIVQTRLWGVSRNRSDEAFVLNPGWRAWNQLGQPGHPLPTASEIATPHDRQLHIDPRLRTWVVLTPDGRSPCAAFTTFGCHSTTMGREHTAYNRDWPGVAVRLVEEEHPGLTAAVALSAEGDASPLPWNDDIEATHGEAWRDQVGAQVADAILDTIAAAPGLAPNIPLEIRVAADEWKPSQDSDERARFWTPGQPILGGAEDGRTSLWSRYHEGMRNFNSMPLHPNQRPKIPALRTILGIAKVLGLKLSCSHPVNRIRFGSHILVTVPGEPTTVGAYRIERRAMASEPGIRGISASVLANAGDYVGYFTTAEEYVCQQYEGSHTLYGRKSLDRLMDAIFARPYGDLGPCPLPKCPREHEIIEVDPDYVDHAPTPWRAPLLIGERGTCDDPLVCKPVVWCSETRGVATPEAELLVAGKWLKAVSVSRYHARPDGLDVWIAVFCPGSAIYGSNATQLRVKQSGATHEMSIEAFKEELRTDESGATD